MVLLTSLDCWHQKDDYQCHMVEERQRPKKPFIPKRDLPIAPNASLSGADQFEVFLSSPLGLGGPKIGTDLVGAVPKGFMGGVVEVLNPKLINPFGICSKSTTIYSQLEKH